VLICLLQFLSLFNIGTLVLQFSIVLLQAIQYGILQKVKIVVLESDIRNLQHISGGYQPSQGERDLAQNSGKTLLFLIALNYICFGLNLVTTFLRCYSR
jgi:hypothetical protein